MLFCRSDIHPQRIPLVHLELSIAADFTAQPLEPLLTWWLERLGVRPRFALAQYDQVEQTLLAERNVFRSSDAGWNLILLRRSRCALERLDGLAQAFHAAARGSERNWGVVVLDDLVDGDSTAQRSPTVWHVAQQLVDRLADIPNVHVWSSRDIDRIYPTDTVVDPIAAQAGDIPFSMEYHWAIATFLTRQLHARLRRPYKVIATDCDNTLWGGVVGEVGPGQLEFSARHLAWQRALVQCAESGMLVCLCSQNNPGDVWQVFEQCPEMRLQRKHLVASQINWLPKPEKLCRLAEELGVGLDSFLFVDDSPLEIAQVRAQLPMVTSVPFPVAGGGNPGSSESPPVTVWLRHLWPLDRHAVTNADQQRTESMRREATRRRYRKQFSTLREFWQSLDLCVEFADLDSQHVERAAQLCQRTNQMNMSLRRHSAGQLSDLAVRPSWQAWTVVARDRFGDYGQTGLMVVEYASDHARVDTFLLSCRALGRTVEFQMLRELGRRALQHGRDTVRIDVVAGPRNQPARAVVELLAGRAVTGEGWVDIAAHRLAQLDPMEAAELCARAAEVSSPSDASADEHPAPAAPASSGTSSLPQGSSPAAGQGPAEYTDLRWIERIPGAFHSVARIQQEWKGSAPAVQRRHGQYSPPRTDLERVLVDACEQVVHLKQVGVEDAFRDLGLTSIQLVLLHSRMCNALHADLPITDFFAASTLRQLAQVIERSASQPGGHAADQPGPLAEPVAIVGMAGRFPGAEDVDAFWRNLAAGIESIVDLADDQLNLPADSPWRRRPDLVRRSAHLDQADAFDAAFFGIFPREAQLMDPQHRVLLECGWHALEDAGYCPDDVAGLVGVFAGCYMNTYALASLATRPELLRRLGDSFFGGELPAELGFDKDYLATRLAFFLDLKGPAVTVQTACSTSLVAIIQACQALQNRQCDMALAGGVTIRFPQRRGYVYTEGSIVSPDGHCRAFDADARGTVFGDGAGMVVLKRLEDARRDGDHIYAVVRGWGINNDGHRKVSYPAPSPDGQAAAIVAALQSAGLSAESISYIEAHGTGTSLGDPIEVSALTAAFRRWTSRTGFCGIGSVKTNIGHLDVAAGVTGVIKVCQALRHEMLPATLHFRRPNPNIDFDRTPFYVVAESQPWPRSQRQEGGDASTAAV
ncbi:MAG: HAD-IIIC family phosphatase, partial [Planctomycetota bacterium]